MKITALAGGVGGAKLAQGFKEILPPDEFSVIVNTGDDFWHLGLYICPDLDTVTYTLAGKANQKSGWGLAGDTFHMMAALKSLGGPDWFHLGDMDLATHLERTRSIHSGDSLTQVTKKISERFGVSHAILPMTDNYVPTFVITEEYGAIPFQEYFVKYRFSPIIKGFIFRDIEAASPTKEVLEKIEESNAIIICPSNPFVSIDPILSLRGMRELLKTKYVIGVSPIVAGKALKGPLAKMYQELGIDPNPHAIAMHYADILDVMYIHYQDKQYKESLNESGIICIEADIILPELKNRVRLANQLIKFIQSK